jgi:hypothetical protein
MNRTAETLQYMAYGEREVVGFPSRRFKPSQGEDGSQPSLCTIHLAGSRGQTLHLVGNNWFFHGL